MPLLDELEDIVEPREDEDVADLVVDASEKDVSATLFVLLQDAQEDAQTGRRDVVQVGTVQDDVLPLHVVEHVHHLFRLPGRRRVESALQQGNHPACSTTSRGACSMRLPLRATATSVTLLLRSKLPSPIFVLIRLLPKVMYAVRSCRSLSTSL